MAKTLSDLFRELSTKAGIKEDDKDLVALLSNTALSVDVPDAISNALNTSLLSIDAAKNNHQVIKSHYFRSAYDGLDKTIGETMDELEFTPEQKADVMNESSSTKRAALLAKKVRDMERAAKKGGDATPAELETLRNKVNELNSELANIKKTSTGNEEKIKERYEKKIKDIHKTGKLSTLVSKYKTIFDNVSSEAKEAAIMAAINAELASGEGLIDVDKTGKLVLTKADGTNFHNENHVQVTPEQFIETALSKNNILLKNNAATPREGGGNQQNNPRGYNYNRPTDNTGGDTGPSKANSRAAALLEQTLQQMEGGNNSHHGLI